MAAKERHRKVADRVRDMPTWRPVVGKGNGRGDCRKRCCGACRDDGLGVGLHAHTNDEMINNKTRGVVCD